MSAYFENDGIVNHLVETGQLPATALDAQMQSYDEMPTRLEMAISLFTKTGTSEAMGSVNAISVRIPSIEYVTIEALAQYSGLSRNKVIVQLLEVALDEVFQGLKPEQRAEVFKIRGDLLMKNMDADGYPNLGGETSKEGEI
jgi:hypothetical protein